MKLDLTKKETAQILETLLAEAARLQQLDWGQERNQAKAEALLCIADKLQNQGASIIIFENVKLGNDLRFITENGNHVDTSLALQSLRIERGDKWLADVAGLSIRTVQGWKRRAPGEQSLRLIKAALDIGTCKKCGRPMHNFHDCILNPIASPTE